MSDYTLYPIKKADVDIILYQLVAHFLKARYHLDLTFSDETSGISFQSLDDDATKDDTGCYFLVFPIEEPTVSYNPEALEKEAIVLKPYLPIEIPYAPLIPEFDDDGELIDTITEDVPMEYFYFSDKSGNLTLEHVKTDEPSRFPDILYNGDAFSEALDKLLNFLKKKDLTEILWYERLQAVRRMLDDDANELHILHNAGLYDNSSLWAWLKDYGIAASEFEQIKERYVSQLKKYAMYALNRLDWYYGTPVEQSDKKNRAGLFNTRMTDEQNDGALEELNRRTKMMHSHVDDSQSHISPTIQSSPTKQSASAEKVGPADTDTPKYTGHGRWPHEHIFSAEFRYSMIIVGCLLPFLWGALAAQVGRAFGDALSFETQLGAVAVLAVVLIVAAYAIKPPKDKIRYHQRCVAAIIISICILVGQLGGAIFLAVND